MSNKANATEASKVNQVTAPVLVDEETAEAGWEDAQLDAPMYKTDLCKGTPLVGYLLGLQEMPESDNGPWQAYTILTTKPCLACTFEGTGEQATVKEYPAGTPIMIVATAKLAGLKAFLNKHYTLEVKVKPLAKKPIGGGRTMWTYEVKRNPTTIRKRTRMEEMTYLPPIAPVHALPVHSGITDDEFPGSN